MISGLPGNMAARVAGLVAGDDAFELLPYSLTGSEITESETVVGPVSVRLFRPEEREELLEGRY